MQSISPQDLKNSLNNGQYQIIDVREPYEFEDFNIGGINIPLDNVLSSVDQIDVAKDVVFCCQSGNRSKAMVMALKRKFKLTNLWTLEGGVAAFKQLTA